MKTTSLLQLVKGAFIALTAFTLGSTAAQAQTSRTWVSGVGDDLNPCSRTAPCKTFAGAISKTAAGGEIDCIDSGAFGAVNITKSLTIDGDGAFAGILAASTNGITVNGAGIVVNLRNLSINGGPPATPGLRGVRIVLGAEVNIENCVIVNFNEASTGKGVDIANTTGKIKVNIRNSVIRNCANGAVHARPTGTGDVAVNISHSSLNSCQFGFKAENNVGAVLSDSVFSGNVNNGILVAATSLASVANVTRCTVNNNGTPPAPAGFGIVSVGALSTIIISSNTVSDNQTGIATQSGGFMISTGNNNVIGNTTNATAAPTSTPGGL